MSKRKKATLATIKSFIRRQLKANNLYIKINSSFDGMVDCVMPVDSQFTKAHQDDFDESNRYTLGIPGIWFVGDSRDYFTEYSNGDFIGYSIYNACGEFVIAMKRLY